MKEQDFTYDFYIGDDNNEKPTVEDIFSNSLGDSVSLSSFSNGGGKKYSKKSHGFWGSIKKWWKKRKAWQKSVIITAISSILILSIAFGVILTVFDYNYVEITENNEDLGFVSTLDKDIVNVALFGIDTRTVDSFEGLSDSIMILSLNTKTKKVKIISVMRDSFVPITYNGRTTHNKINSAYKTGGPELAIKVLNTNFGLDIAEYATVNFFGMVDIIDAVGGIDAELTRGEVGKLDGTLHHINGCIQEICSKKGVDPKNHYISTPGKQHLNGIQAVAYSRIRYVANIWGTNNDYGRTDRQRYVMEQLFNKAITLEKSKYVKLAKSLIPCSQTSLSYTEILDLAFSILLQSPTFSQARMPQQEFTMRAPSTSAGSVVYYDLEYAKDIIHAFIYDDITFEEYIEQNGIQKNDWYKGGVTRPSTDSSSSEPNRSDVDSSSTPPNKDNSSNQRDDNSSGSSSEDDASSDDTSSDDTSSDDTPSDDTPSDDSSVSSDSSDTKPSKPDNSSEDPESSEVSGSAPSGDNEGSSEEV